MKIIKFGAVWCPGCLIMRPIWKEVVKDYPNLDITEYDYDMDEDLVEKYDIGNKLPVVIMLDDSNNEIKRLIGERKKEEIIKFIEER